MNRESTHTHIRECLALLGALGVLTLGLANAQVPVDEEGNPITPIGDATDSTAGAAPDGPRLSAAELETLVGPVALYPDDLLAIVLPASTYPLEIVQAARFLERLDADSSLQPNEDWDESIIALLNYPEVVNMMDDDIDWTWRLGEAVVAQQSELIAAVESFRDRAYAAGNLKTDEYQTVSNDGGIIEIDPVDDDIIYVPYYEPERVVVYSPSPVYHYYPTAYPVYYYPYGAGHYFGSSLFWGVSTAFTIGWANDCLHVYHHSYSGHPYYGHTYYGSHYWHQSSLFLYNSHYVNNHHYRSHDYSHHGDYWRPRHHGGARPGRQVARNTYYSGNRQSATQTSTFRDGRTDGLNYNGNDRSSRASTRGGRSAVEFRQRGNNTFTGTVAPRLERAADNSSRPVAGRSTNARNGTRRSGSDAVRYDDSDRIRFRARESSANLSANARQSRRPETPVRLAQNSRSSQVANNSTRSVRSTARRPTTSPATPSVRQSAPARVSSAQRQNVMRSQPQRNTVSRPPRQSQPAPRQSSAPRPSSQHRSAPRSSAPARSSSQSHGQKRSSRKRK